MSVDLISFAFTFDEALYLRYQRFGLHSKDGGLDGGVAVSLKAGRRAGFRAPGPHGLRRQCHRSLVRDDRQPRRLQQHNRHVHARHVRWLRDPGRIAFFRLATAFGLMFTPVFYVIARWVAGLGQRWGKRVPAEAQPAE
jgi:hypothetical protein